MGKGGMMMVDREKVISGLHCCAHTDGANCIDCPYDMYYASDCTVHMSMDVLELLKELDDDLHHAGLIVWEYEKELNKQPKIVRCEDCKFAEKNVIRPKEYEYKCTLSEFEGLYDYHGRGWFCADGKAR